MRKVIIAIIFLMIWLICERDFMILLIEAAILLLMSLDGGTKS